MKNAAKCDTQCELQNSASHQIFERKWRQFTGMFVSVCLESIKLIIYLNVIEKMLDIFSFIK
jgi:hypothetical protein